MKSQISVNFRYINRWQYNLNSKLDIVRINYTLQGIIFDRIYARSW